MRFQTGRGSPVWPRYKTTIRTFVDATAPRVAGGTVFADGGDLDVSAEVSVVELVRLVEGELLDVERSPAPRREEIAGRVCTVFFPAV